MSDEELIARFDKVDAQLSLLIARAQVREYYSTQELAPLIGKGEFTVREYCRRGRLHAQKRLSGRGGSAAWVVSHEEFLRYQRRGLLPLVPSINSSKS